MNDYQKIATIVVRGFAYYLLLWVVIEWAIIAMGTLLITFGIISRTSIAFEARLLSSVVYLLAGLVLLARSRSLGNRIAADMEENESEGQSDLQPQQ
jgi:thiol:disulfide interchange protein